MADNLIKTMHDRIVEGGRRGGQSTSLAKQEATRRNAQKARETKELYRRFPILRGQK